ncbi:hypothetical protein HPB51_018666 [Rhipicephalus microplus]|uniref:Uncharacterized protein n=1 Tax=Rhipicephalus microplus TaxID=6941 RepID=A0A9J6DAY7_RHIMP|nr:hypothetical protein HPB51_018666 [Rhipicephalus microplus]
MRDCGCSALADSGPINFERVAAASAAADLRACPAASTTMPLFSACVRGGTPVPNGGRRVPEDCRASATGSEERLRYGRVYSTTRSTPSHSPPPPFDAARPRGLNHSRSTTSSWHKKIYASSGTTQDQCICLRCYSMRPALEASCTAYTPCLRGDRGACDHNLDGGASPSKAVGSESPLKLGGNLGASPRPPLKKSPSRSGLSATVIAAAAPKSRHVAPGVNNKSTCLHHLETSPKNHESRIGKIDSDAVLPHFLSAPRNLRVADTEQENEKRALKKLLNGTCLAADGRY